MTEAPPLASGAPVAGAPLVELHQLTKTFGDLVANDRVSLAVQPGEVHALLGENGAGKSTLTRMLYGLSKPDAVEIRVDGRAVSVSGPADAMRAGIGLVTQEFSLVGPMTVTENVMLSGVGYGRLDRRAARAKVTEAAERLGVDVDPDARVEDLSVGERQRVEILKALFHDCRLLVLDEPTAVLVPGDVARLFASIRRLTAQGMGVIFISHKLHEVVEIADTVSILRRGRIIASRPAAGLDTHRIAAMMVGGEVDTADAGLEAALGLDDAEPLRETHTMAATATPALSITGLTLHRGDTTVLDGLGIDVAPGEIVGVAGVSGNGQTELVDVLSGTLAPTGGSVSVAGRDVTRMSVTERLAAGLGRLNEDRRGSVVLHLSVEQNLVIEDLERFRTGPFLNRRRVRAHAQRLIERFDIRAMPTDPIRSLSGGNMQKVLLARAIDRDPTALVVSQPTRGLDVGACRFVYEQLRGLTDRGAGVLMVSEDLDELIGVCDRIVVILEGRIVGEADAATATREQLGVMMTGGAL